MVIECTNPQTVCERGMCRWMKKERGAERGVWTVMKKQAGDAGGECKNGTGSSLHVMVTATYM